MAVRMMRIRHVRMRVPQRLMPMPVTVRTGGHRIMDMLVVSVIVAVSVFMFNRFVLMLVTVGLRQMQHHAGEHQYAARRHQRAGRWVAQNHGQHRADERGEREDRTCARSTEGSLREQIEPQAEGVDGGRNGEALKRRAG